MSLNGNRTGDVTLHILFCLGHACSVLRVYGLHGQSENYLQGTTWFVQNDLEMLQAWNKLGWFLPLLGR